MGVLRSAIKEVRQDFVSYDDDRVDQNLTEAWAVGITDAFESVQNVRDAVAYVYVTDWMYANQEGETLEVREFWGNYTFFGTLVFLQNDSSAFFDSYEIEGALPDPNTVAVPEFVSDELGIEIGENITLAHRIWQGSYYNETLGYYVDNYTYQNLSYEVSQIWAQPWDSGTSWWYYGEYAQKPDEMIATRDHVNPIFFNLADIVHINWSSIDSSPYFGPDEIFYIWIDRGEVVNLGDVSGTIARLDDMRSQLQRKAYSYGFYVDQSELVYPLESVSPQLEVLKILFGALSLPVIGLGIYLSLVGVDLGVNERRRELGILKSRGASNRQVFFSLLTESVVLGAAAGAAGLLIGILISRFLLNIAASFSWQEDVDPLLTDISISGTTVFLSIFFGALLMLLSSFRPFKKISRADVAEMLHHYSPVVAHVEYRPRTDIILLSLSALCIISIEVGPGWAFEQNWSWIVVIIVTLIFLVGIAFFPLMPFLLSLGVIRLLTRSSSRLYAKFTRLVRPWTKELHYLVDRNIVRNPRRASNLCVIIALALAFGIFISVTMESTTAYEHDLIKYEVGSDVKLLAPYSYGGASPEAQNLSALGSIEGVRLSCVFESTDIMIGSYWGGYYGAYPILLDVDSYEQVANPRDSFFVTGGSEKLGELKENGTVLVSESASENYDIRVGDILQVMKNVYVDDNGSWYYRELRFSVLVIGVVKGLPGFPYSEMFMDRGSVEFLSREDMASGSYSAGALLALEPGADAQDVVSDARDVFSSAGFPYVEALVLEDEMEALESNPTFEAVAGFFYMEYALSVAIMTVGVGMLIFVSVTDREQELACIMARGCSGSQMRKILMGESTTLMIIGLLVGASVGLLTAFLFNELTDVQSYSAIERRMVFTYITLGIVVASGVSLIMASLVATLRAGRIRLAEVLRIRGG
jgi:putative ABC transport system permease protein